MVSRPVDPLATLPEDQQRLRGSLWWSHASHKYARDPAHGADSAHLRGLLEAGEWTDPPQFQKSTARSLMAWRGLWSVPRLDLIEQFIDEGLAPPGQDVPDWWSSAYFRQKALRNLFLPIYPAPAPSAPAAILAAYRAKEETRRRLSSKLCERHPGLFSLALPDPSEPLKGSVFRHPLLVTARPGLEADFRQFLDACGIGAILRTRDNPGMTPVQLLEIGLKRRFEPLIELALSAGAAADTPLDDPRGGVRSLLHVAIASADTVMVDWLLAQQPHLEVWDRFARTPFLAAARMSDVATMEKLLAAGANPLAVDRFGQSAAHLAIEGISTTTFDRKTFAENGQRQYLDKTPEQIEQGLTRAGHAVAWLGAHGVDLLAPCQPAPKKSKTKDSPYAGLPRAARQPPSAKPGETWEAQLERRCQDTAGLGEKALALFRAAKMATALAWILPEPEEGGLEPEEPTALPPRRARM